MPDYAIVTDELRRLTVRVIPVALVIFGLLVCYNSSSSAEPDDNDDH